MSVLWSVPARWVGRGKAARGHSTSFSSRRAHVLGTQRELLLEGYVVKSAELVEGLEGANFFSSLVGLSLFSGRPVQ